jgi:hypothetical protein
LGVRLRCARLAYAQRSLGSGARFASGFLSVLGQWLIYEVDADGHALAYVDFEDEPGRRAAPHLLARNEARRFAANPGKLPRLLQASD